MDSNEAQTFDLEDLTNLEQAFYDKGFSDGHTHGRIHGLIEGRALGKEKGYEIWEEAGFYEGFAVVWRALLDVDPSAQEKHSRTLRHIAQLLELISQFPTRNPSHLAAISSPSPIPAGERTSQQDQPMDEADPAASATTPQTSPLDMTRIRSKYRLICAILGVKPRLVAASTPSSSATPNPAIDANQLIDSVAVAEVQMGYEDEHPDSRAKAKKSNSIWRIDRPGGGGGGVSHNEF